MPDLVSRLLLELAQALRERQTSAQELIEAAIARHERYGERPHAYSLWHQNKRAKPARRQMRRFAAGATVGPLQGTPISIKDLLAAEGFACFAGSGVGCRQFRGRKTDRRDAAPSARCHHGQDPVVEFVFGGTGHNSRGARRAIRGTRQTRRMGALR